MSNKAEGEVKYNKYWGLENDVAGAFNRLKAKLFNLIEATVTDKVQQAAIKGLIKGFANDEYNHGIENMRYTATDAGFIGGDQVRSAPPITSEPLENRTF